jgi:hypothetical protein
MISTLEALDLSNNNFDTIDLKKLSQLYPKLTQLNLQHTPYFNSLDANIQQDFLKVSFKDSILYLGT